MLSPLPPLKIVLVNKSSVVSDDECEAMVRAMNDVELGAYCAAWRTSATLLFRPRPKTRSLVSELLAACAAEGADYAILMVDEDPAVSGAEGYHDEVVGGPTGSVPYGKILCKTILGSGTAAVLYKDGQTGTVAQCLSHEIYGA